jgi:hypothetical protein
MKADSGGGILLYIILGLVFVVSTIFEKKNKQQSHRPSNPVPRNIWDEMDDERAESQQEAKQPPVEEYQQNTFPSRAVNSGNETTVMDAEHEGVSVFNYSKVVDAYHLEKVEAANYVYVDEIKKSEISDVDEDTKENYSFHFNLGDAIIYSEILNRKYF